MWRVSSYPDPKKLAGGIPDLGSVYTTILRLSFRQCLWAMLGARIVVRATFVTKGPGIDIESNACLLHPLDKRTSHEINQDVKDVV